MEQRGTKPEFVFVESRVLLDDLSSGNSSPYMQTVRNTAELIAALEALMFSCKKVGRLLTRSPMQCNYCGSHIKIDFVLS